MRHAIVLLATVICWTAPTELQAQTPNDGEETMKILVHITHGPEAPTRSALGFHVAKAALEEGHDVTVFLAGDGVQLLRRGTLDHMSGLGTGELGALYDAVVSGGAAFYLSGGSSRARSLEEDDLGGLSVQFASPQELVQLSVEHDRMFTY